MAAQELYTGKLEIFKSTWRGISAHPTWCLWQSQQHNPYRCGAGARLQSRTRSEGAGEWERERAQADLYLSPSDIFLGCNTQQRTCWSLAVAQQPIMRAVFWKRSAVGYNASRLSVCFSVCRWKTAAANGWRLVLTLVDHVCFRRRDGLVACGAPMLHDECSAARFTK